MGQEKTIKGMHKPELLSLIKDSIDDINNIKKAVEDVETKKTSIEEVDNLINGDDGILVKIETAQEDINEKFDQIKKAYNEICEDDNEGKSIKSELEELVDVFEQDKKKIKEFKRKILGFKKKKEDGSLEHIGGLFDDINDFYDLQQKKYGSLYEKIEKELLSGATTVNLAKVFSEKVGEYKKNVTFWTKFFVIIMFVFVVYYGIDRLLIDASDYSLQNIFFHLSYNSPFLAFGVWLAIFVGNRRAESKKLEEAYKHKEVMARSFTGYKRSIEELDNEDKELLKKHMDNLLEAIKEDPGSFLDSKGEKYPIVDFFEQNRDKIVKIIDKAAK